MLILETGFYMGKREINRLFGNYCRLRPKIWHMQTTYEVNHVIYVLIQGQGHFMITKCSDERFQDQWSSGSFATLSKAVLKSKSSNFVSFLDCMYLESYQLGLAGPLLSEPILSAIEDILVHECFDILERLK